MEVRVLTIRNVAASGSMFALVVALTMASGGPEPVSFAYYGVAADWRTPVLLLPAALQVLWIGDAIVLDFGQERADVDR